jgi:hypothetical protein
MYSADDTSFRFPASRTNRADQAVHYVPQFGRLVQQVLPLLRWEVRQFLSNHQLGFNFDMRSSRPRQKIMEFIRRETGLSSACW